MSERHIRAQLLRKGEVVRERAYARVDTAVPRTLQLALIEGQVGDIVEVYHNITGLQIGTIKMHAAAKPTINWLWDEYTYD